MRSLAAAACLLLPCLSAARAQTLEPVAAAASQEEEAPGFTFEGKQKFGFGNQHYRNSDTSLDFGLPAGFDVNADLTAFKSDTSSTTPTFTFGAGKSWDQGSLDATYAISPLANDVRSNAVDVIASAFTDSDDFRSTVSGDVVVTHTRVYLRFPVITKEVDMTQRTPTITLKQQFYGTRVEGAFSEYTYNFDVPIAAAILNSSKLNRFSHFTGGLAGLIQGFPDHSEKFSLYRDLGFAPVTLWGSYESIHFIDSAFQFHATADNIEAGADLDLLKVLTGSLQYTHVRQTGQVSIDQYSAGLSVHF